MPSLSVQLFDYELPPDRIAQAPAGRRDGSRLLVVDRAARSLAHRSFSDLPEYLRSGDTLIRNNASVLPARLFLRRPTGGRVECFLLAPAVDAAVAASVLEGASGAGGSGGRRLEPGEAWRCLVRPGRRLPAGAVFTNDAGDVRGEIVSKAEDGSATVRFSTPSGESVAAIAARIGEIPLPPYIVRMGGHPGEEDRERYQTVYADRARAVAVAAPTAGLHFTPGLLQALSDRGVRTADITLHVGLGTFKPIATETVEAHAIHREVYEIPAEVQALLLGPAPGRRIAVGTTSVRASEDFLSRADLHFGPDRSPRTVCAEAGIFIYPPRPFRGIDALITNFHQPRSTLLCLVSAFLTPGSTDGIAWLREIYAEALREGYRFLSYGDAMLIV